MLGIVYGIWAGLTANVPFRFFLRSLPFNSACATVCLFFINKSGANFQPISFAKPCPIKSDWLNPLKFSLYQWMGMGTRTPEGGIRNFEFWRYSIKTSESSRPTSSEYLYFRARIARLITPSYSQIEANPSKPFSLVHFAWVRPSIDALSQYGQMGLASLTLATQSGQI